MTDATRIIIGILKEAKDLNEVNTKEAMKLIDEVIAKLTFNNIVI